jgi:hypothetical protein
MFRFLGPFSLVFVRTSTEIPLVRRSGVFNTITAIVIALYSRADRSVPKNVDQLISYFIDQSDFIFEQSDWSMKQEVRNFLRNLSNC